jgi:hypothetical protein
VTRASRRVRFAPNQETSVSPVVAINGDHGIPTRSKRQRTPVDSGCDADDDADASDVEDFVADESSDGEFEAEPSEMDDETTIAN